MTRRFYTIEEIDEMIREDKANIYRISLFNGRHNKVIGWNNSRKTVPGHWQRIKGNLLSTHCQPGIYQVLIKKSASAAAAAEVFDVNIGGVNEDELPKPNNIPRMEENTQFNTKNNQGFEVYLKMSNDITRLQTENQFITRDNAELKEKVIRLEEKLNEALVENDELREDNFALSENKQTGLSQFVPTLTSFVERYFDIMEKKAMNKNNQNPVADQNMQFANLVEISTGEYFDVERGDIENLLSFFKSQNDLNEFIADINKSNPQQAAILVKRINGYMKAQQDHFEKQQGDDGDGSEGYPGGTGHYTEQGMYEQ